MRVAAKNRRHLIGGRRVDRRKTRLLLGVDQFDAIDFERVFKAQHLVDGRVIRLDLAHQYTVANHANVAGVDHRVIGEPITIERRQDEHGDTDRGWITGGVGGRGLDLDPPTRGIEALGERLPGRFFKKIAHGRHAQGRYAVDLVDISDVGADVLRESGDLCRLAHAIGARLIPVVDLQTDEHADDDDYEVDRDRRPFLLAEMPDDAAQDHGAESPLKSAKSARRRAPWPQGAYLQAMAAVDTGQ